MQQASIREPRLTSINSSIRRIIVELNNVSAAFKIVIDNVISGLNDALINEDECLMVMLTQFLV